MSIIEAIILGIVQGLTEFIPVSSSGHLILISHALGFDNGGLAFDVALHIGTLLALIIYFHRDIVSLVKALFIKSSFTKLARLIAVATVPAVVAGVLLQDTAETTFRSPYLVASMLIVVGLLMLLAERYAARRPAIVEAKDSGWRQAIFIGFAQVAALVPGVSRAGSTITAGLFSGLGRVAATRFSFLLAIPITFGATIKMSIDGNILEQAGQGYWAFSFGILAAFASGLFAIRFLLNFLSKHSLATFAYYRLGLGLIVLVALFATR